MVLSTKKFNYLVENPSFASQKNSESMKQRKREAEKLSTFNRWILKQPSSVSVRNLRPNSLNVTDATMHIYKQTFQNTSWNDTEYTGRHDIL